MRHLTSIESSSEFGRPLPGPRVFMCMLLGVASRLITRRAEYATARYLRSLDDRTLKDLGFDPRDLPIRDQIARSHGRSVCERAKISADYWI